MRLTSLLPHNRANLALALKPRSSQSSLKEARSLSEKARYQFFWFSNLSYVKTTGEGGQKKLKQKKNWCTKIKIVEDVTKVQNRKLLKFLWKIVSR